MIARGLVDEPEGTVDRKRQAGHLYPPSHRDPGLLARPDVRAAMGRDHFDAVTLVESKSISPRTRAPSKSDPSGSATAHQRCDIPATRAWPTQSMSSGRIHRQVAPALERAAIAHKGHASRRQRQIKKPHLGAPDWKVRHAGAVHSRLTGQSMKWGGVALCAPRQSSSNAPPMSSATSMTADRLTRAAADDGADLVVLPERLDIRGAPEQYAAKAQSRSTAASPAGPRGPGRELGIDLVAGSIAERREGHERWPTLPARGARRRDQGGLSQDPHVRRGGGWREYRESQSPSRPRSSSCRRQRTGSGSA